MHAVLPLLLVAPTASAATPPVAVDDAYTTALDDNLSVDAPGVLENDSDPDGGPLTAMQVGGTGAGVLRLFSDGSLEYEPASTGAHTFTYVASDRSQTSNAATITFTVTGARGGATTYTSQAAFLADLNAMGYGARIESFEDDAVWGATRTSSVPSVTSMGLTWTSNVPANGVRTGQGSAVSGSWGFFSLPHGNYASGMPCSVPGECGDGWRGSAAETLVAIGGWVHGNPPGGKVQITLDDDPARAHDAGQIVSTTFFGVIDPVGFHAFEFREVEGVPTDLFSIFGDHFTFARKVQRPLLHVADLGFGTIGVGAPAPDGSPSLVPGSLSPARSLELWLDCEGQDPGAAFVLVADRPALGPATIAGPALLGGRTLLVHGQRHAGGTERVLLDLADPSLLGRSPTSRRPASAQKDRG